jgi:hypothetical protein
MKACKDNYAPFPDVVKLFLRLQHRFHSIFFPHLTSPGAGQQDGAEHNFIANMDEIYFTAHADLLSIQRASSKRSSRRNHERPAAMATYGSGSAKLVQSNGTLDKRPWAS